MLWTIVGAIVAFAAFVTTLASLVAKRIRENTKVQTEVAVELKQIATALKESNEKNSAAHKEFYSKLENHEGRIKVLEVKVDEEHT